jgi:hypothetical protein
MLQIDCQLPRPIALQLVTSPRQLTHVFESRRRTHVVESPPQDLRASGTECLGRRFAVVRQLVKLSGAEGDIQLLPVLLTLKVNTKLPFAPGSVKPEWSAL